MSKPLTPAEQDLIDRFKDFSASEKAAALRALARDTPDRKTQRKLIMAALRMDAVDLDKDRGLQWKDLGYKAKPGPFIDDDEFLPKKKP